MDDNPYKVPEASANRKKSPVLRAAIQVLIVLVVIGVLVALLIPAQRGARGAAHRSSCKNNLKNLALALHNYPDTYGAFPPAYTTDAEGKPLHSWRTLLLPYVEQKALYESIDLTKPWDDPVNAEALRTRVPLYQCPSAPHNDHRTSYLAVVTPNSCFRATEPRKLAELTDGPSTTLMLIEVDADHAVPWMAPIDADEKLVLSLNPESNLAHPGGMHAVFADAHVQFLRAETAVDVRRALISIAGKDNDVFELED